MNAPRSPWVFVLPRHEGGKLVPGELEYLGPDDEIRKLRILGQERIKRAFVMATKGYLPVTSRNVGEVAVDLILALEWGFYRELSPVDEEVRDPSGLGQRASACLYCKQVNPNSPFVPRFHPDALDHKADCLVKAVVDAAI